MRMILDCDWVLVDYAGRFVPWLCGQRGLAKPATPLNTYDMAGWLGIPHAMIMEGILEFNSGVVPEFGQLAPLPDAVHALATLAERGWDLRVISSATANPAGVALRERHLAECFGPVFTEITCLGIGASKQDVLMALPPSIFIDDLPVNLQAGLAAGHDSYLMTAAHNAHYTALPRVRDWRHIMDIAGAAEPDPHFRP